jgi:hypothetical protein
MSTTDGTADRAAPTPPPSYLKYHRSDNLLGAGVGLVVGGQTCLIAAVFAAIKHVPLETASLGTHSTGLTIALLVIGLLLSLIGLMVLIVGVLYLAGNVDMMAWSMRERMRVDESSLGR